MGGSRSPQLARLLDVCEQIESAHARLYRTLAEAHAADLTMAALWRKTANEEDGHAAQFRLASSSYSCGIESVSIDPTQATRILNVVQATVERVRSEPPGIREALRLAIQMEETMAALHMDQLARFQNPAHQKLFKAMMGVDQAHVQSLRDALAQIEGERARTD